LVYKMAILTGLRLNELRTLRVADLSFGDVPFVALRSANEKNRKGSTTPLREDLADDLRKWIAGKGHDEPVFDVPSGLLRILNRDLVAAGIDKIDDRGQRVHLHALRHSTASHLSAVGVSPRTAQSVMRHSDIALTMRTYTDERLLNAAGAVALLPDLPLGEPTHRKRTEADSLPAAGRRPRTVTPTVTPGADNLGVTGSISDKIGKVCGPAETGSENEKTPEKPGLNASGQYWIRTGDLCRVNERVDGRFANELTGYSATVAEPLPQRLPLAADLPDLAEALRALLDPDERRRLAVELLRE
jgi:hypothetical protein